MTKRIFGWIVMFMMMSAVAWADAPKQKLVGKWALSAKEASLTVVFTGDGKIMITPGHDEPVVEGTYHWVDDSSIEVSLAKLKDKPEHLQIVIDGDELTTTDHKGTVDKFTRVK